MSIKVMSWVWDNSPYSGAALLVHLAFADWADDDGLCWPSQVKVAHKARCSVEHVRKVTRQMEADGTLVVERESAGRGKPTHYRVVARTPNSVGVNSETPNSGIGNPQLQPEKAPTLPPNNRQEPSVEQPSTTEFETNAIALRPTDYALNAPLDLSLLMVDPDIPTRIFEVFWDVYPRHTGGKPTARKAWDEAIKTTDPQVIVDGALRFREDPNRLDEFTPHPSTWLNQNRWADDPLPARGASTRQSGTATFVKAFEPQGRPLIELDW